MSALKSKITDDMKAAMKAGDKELLQTIRLIMAALKQQEVDTRKELSDADVTAILIKMQKQRKESIAQFETAERQDLVDKETLELSHIEVYLPEQMSEQEVDALISETLKETGASTMKDMGKVMGLLKPKLAGRADMGMVSSKIKTALNS